MQTAFDLLRHSRANYVHYLDNYSLDQLNTVPLGYKNNLIWNIGHIVATADILMYKMNGLPMQMDEPFIEAYRKGSQPEVAVNQTFVDKLRNDIEAQVVRITTDYENKVFPASVLKPYTTSFGNTLNTIEDALSFNLIHEGLHHGIMLNIRKFI
jgi:hypothetical protein